MCYDTEESAFFAEREMDTLNPNNRDSSAIANKFIAETLSYIRQVALLPLGRGNSTIYAFFGFWPL